MSVDKMLYSVVNINLLICYRLLKKFLQIINTEAILSYGYQNLLPGTAE